MRTLAGPSRRRVPGSAACEEPPRLWGESPRATAATVTMPAPAEPVAREAAAAPAGASAPTLDELISGAWDGLVAASAAACPVCAAAMAPRWSGAGVVGGRCGGCGSTLE